MFDSVTEQGAPVTLSIPSPLRDVVSVHSRPIRQLVYVPRVAAVRVCRPRLPELRGDAVMRTFHAFSLDCFHGVSLTKNGRLVEPVVQGSSLFSVVDQDDNIVTYRCSRFSPSH